MTRDIQRALCEAGYAPLRDYVEENMATDKPKPKPKPQQSGDNGPRPTKK